MKRILAVLTSMTLIVSSLSVQSFAAEIEDEENFGEEISVEDNLVEDDCDDSFVDDEVKAEEEQIGASTDTSGILVNDGVSYVSWELDEDGLLSISGTGIIPDHDYYNPVFDKRTDIKKVVFSEGITEVGFNLFYNCTGIESVSIPSTVTKFGGIGNNESVFEDCNIVGSGFSVAENNEGGFFTDDGCLYKDYGTYIYLYKYAGEHSTYTVPNELNGKLVDDIVYQAFFDCTLDTLTIKAKSFSRYSIMDTHIKHLNFGEGLETFGPYCSNSDCEDTVLNLPSTLKNLDTWDQGITEESNYIEYSVATENETFETIDGVLFKKSNNGRILWKYPMGKTDESYCIPEETVEVQIGSFGVNTSNPYLKNIVLPFSLTKVSHGSFNIEFDSVTVLNSELVIPYDFCYIRQTSIFPDKIYGFTNSYAAEYASDNDVTFEELTVVLSETKFDYDEEEHKPSVTAVKAGSYSIPLAYFEISYPEDCTTPGVKNVTVSAVSGGGTVSGQFKIGNVAFTSLDVTCVKKINKDETVSFTVKLTTEEGPVSGATIACNIESAVIDGVTNEDGICTVTVKGEDIALGKNVITFEYAGNKEVSPQLWNTSTDVELMVYPVNTVETGKLVSDGENEVEYYLSATGDLTIRGTGIIPKLDSTTTPFYNREDIKSVTFEEGITEVGSNLFVDCKGIESVSIPASIERMSSYYYMDSVFNRAPIGKKGFTVAENNKGGFYSQDGCLFKKESDEEYIFYAFGGEHTEYEIPMQDGKLVSSVAHMAFQGCTLDKLVINAKILCSYATARVNIKHIVLNEGLTTIKSENIFAGSEDNEINFPSTITEIDSFNQDVLEISNVKAFNIASGCAKMESIDGVIFRKVGDERILLFYPFGKSDETYSIPNGTISIENNAFGRSNKSNAYLKNIIIPESLITLNQRSFNNKLDSLTVLNPTLSLTDDYFGDGSAAYYPDCIYCSEDSLAAVWANAKGIPVKPSPYATAVFCGNGAEEADLKVYFLPKSKIKLPVNSFTKTGYIFTGWKYGKNVYKEGEEIAVSKAEAGKSYTISAQWKVDKNYPGYSYAIEFDSNGGTGTMKKLTANVGTAKKLTANAFKKTGYHLAGWSDKADGAVVYANSEKVLDLSIKYDSTEIKLFAVWAPNSYTVTFNGNGGTFIPTGKTKAAKTYTQILNYDTEETLDKSPFAKKGYTLLGWSKSAKAKEATYTDMQKDIFNLVSSNNGKVTLYAVWKANGYTISFDGNGATGEMAPVETAYSKTVKLPANSFVKEGYHFTGWKLDLNDKKYANKASVKNLFENGGVAKFTAQWELNTAKYVFNMNGGKAPDKTSYASVKLTTGDVLDLEKPIPTFDGYEFMGWSTRADGDGRIPGTYNYSEQRKIEDFKVTGNGGKVTLYAVWKYKVTLNPGEGEGVAKDVDMFYKRSTELSPSEFTKKGYYIAGWNTVESKAQAGKIQYKATAVKNVKPGSTLYAVWKPVTYKVVFHINNGKDTVKNQTMTYGKTTALAKNSFTWKGHKFLGWAETSDGTVKYQNKESVTNLAETKDSVIDLYAIWE